MMMNTTLDQLRGLKLVSMAQALQEQMQQSGISAMSFEERLALLVDREVHGRQDRRCAKLLKTARLKYPQAMIEDLDCRASRGIDRATVMSLTLGPWVSSGHTVLITGPTPGIGKSFTCANFAAVLAAGGKRVVLFALPGAFTPTCSTYQLPGFEKGFGDFAALGIDSFDDIAAQADALDEILDVRGRKLDHVIELLVEEDALVDRITGRFSCGNCGAVCVPGITCMAPFSSVLGAKAIQAETTSSGSRPQ